MNGPVPFGAGALNLGGKQDDAFIQFRHGQVIQILPCELGSEIARARPGRGVIKIHAASLLHWQALSTLSRMRRAE